MAVTQYIGARYVPIFYENSLGTNDWTPNTIYEPLTIVTLNANSYTSKKLVPASVGSPDLNPEYWAATGIYNAQVEQYREEVEDLADDYAVIAPAAKIGAETSFFYGKKIIVFGDSQCTEPDSDTNYWAVLANTYGLDVNNQAVAGTALGGNLTRIQSTDFTGYDVCVLAFGCNEWQGNENKLTLQGYLATAAGYVRASNPKTQIVFITPFWGYNATFSSGAAGVNDRGCTLEDYVRWFNEKATELQIPVIDFYHTSGCSASNYTALLDPSTGTPPIYVHPKADFAEKLAQIVLNATFDTYAPDDAVNPANYFNIANYGANIVRTASINGGSVPQNAIGGFMLEIAANSSVSDTNAFYIPDTEMELSGYASGNVDFEIRHTNNTLIYSGTIIAGAFKRRFTFNSVTPCHIKFTNNSGSTIYLGKLKLREVSTNYGYQDHYGRGVAVSAATGVTLNSIIHVRSDEKSITMCDGAFTLASSAAAASNIASANIATPPQGVFFATNKLAQNGNPAFVYWVGGDLKTESALAAGTYRIMGATKFFPER